MDNEYKDMINRMFDNLVVNEKPKINKPSFDLPNIKPSNKLKFNDDFLGGILGMELEDKMIVFDPSDFSNDIYNENRDEILSFKATGKFNLDDKCMVPENKMADIIGLTLNEFNLMRNMFLDFQDSASDSLLYPYVYAYLEEMAIKCQELELLISEGKNFNDEFSKDLPEEELRKMQILMGIRNRILNHIYSYYSKED